MREAALAIHRVKKLSRGVTMNVEKWKPRQSSNAPSGSILQRQPVATKQSQNAASQPCVYPGASIGTSIEPRPCDVHAPTKLHHQRQLTCLGAVSANITPLGL